jgi:hypothetical protein
VHVLLGTSNMNPLVSPAQILSRENEGGLTFSQKAAGGSSRASHPEHLRFAAGAVRADCIAAGGHAARARSGGVD